MDTKEGRGHGMNWEVGTDIYILLCMKQITNECDTGNHVLW